MALIKFSKKSQFPNFQRNSQISSLKFRTEFKFTKIDKKSEY